MVRAARTAGTLGVTSMTEVGQDGGGDEWDDWVEDPDAIANCAAGAGAILQTSRKGVTFGHGTGGLKAAEIQAPELVPEFDRLIGLWKARQDPAEVLNGEPSVTCVVDQARGIFIIANERQFKDVKPLTPVHAAALVIA
jgi:hypothetical protein